MSTSITVPAALAAEQIATGLNLPRRRGKAAATLVLEEAIFDIVYERHPITVRGVCYALFTQGLIPDMSVNSTGKISRVMTEMRENDELDWTLNRAGGKPSSPSADCIAGSKVMS